MRTIPNVQILSYDKGIMQRQVKLLECLCVWNAAAEGYDFVCYCVLNQEETCKLCVGSDVAIRCTCLAEGSQLTLLLQCSHGCLQNLLSIHKKRNACVQQLAWLCCAFVLAYLKYRHFRGLLPVQRNAGISAFVPKQLSLHVWLVCLVRAVARDVARKLILASQVAIPIVVQYDLQGCSFPLSIAHLLQTTFRYACSGELFLRMWRFSFAPTFGVQWN